MRKNYKKENEILLQMLKDIIWMAVRYAHGRHTYAPSIVRDVMIALKKRCPDYRYYDITIKPQKCISCNKLHSVEYGGYLELKDCSYVICADCCRTKLGLL